MPITLIRYLPYLIGIGAIVGGLYALYHYGYTEGEGHERNIHLEAQAKRNAEDAKKVHDLETAKNANLATIDRLVLDNNRLKRLYLNSKRCSDKASPDDSAGGGVVHEDVSSIEEQALNEFDLTYRAEAERADKIVEGCRVLNSYLK